MFEGVGQCLRSSAWCYSVWRIVFCHFCLVYNEHLIRCGYCTVYCTISDGRRVYVCACTHAYIPTYMHTYTCANMYSHAYITPTECMRCHMKYFSCTTASHFTLATGWCTGNYFWKSYLEIIIINVTHLLEYYLPLAVKSWVFLQIMGLSMSGFDCMWLSQMCPSPFFIGCWLS